MSSKLYTHLAAALLLLAATGARATILTIQVGGSSNSFTPSSATIVLGDTVRWQWAAGTHTTTSLGIPGGATAWNQPMTSSSTTYTYKPSQLGAYNYQCNPHAPGMAGTFTVTAPTPVKMGDLTSKIDAQGRAALAWTTYSEEQNRHFEIQRSADGFAFAQAGQLPSQAPGGNSTQKHDYRFTDPSPIVERAFYRLRQVDLDGKGSYSNVVFLALKGENDLQLHLHPNPVKDKLNIHIAGRIGKNAVIELVDINGKTIQTKVPDPDNTVMTVFDMSKMQPGQYLVQYKDDNQDITKKVTKE
ncbi:T9SS type A sorting domain-containing protein [Taibaiella chishuiensis]|uniref:Putative secreted protein (Por secretion system target) n=1 Tax=Taibaiella chishuiensis TaxID=1434707 RepID=A0A2P8DDD5_9BACT|nr:T9SS type A sorting domain-containing protein [Taibaiella chishuiensis]PSK95209.1 putative secreted protein (Por secretion system target) [Taibaiella chishuiensis]